MKDLGSPESELDKVLKELLSADVEIGETKLADKYVEFIAWKGSLDQRIARASECVKRYTRPDTEFAYWLALRKNVDQFEQ